MDVLRVGANQYAGVLGQALVGGEAQADNGGVSQLDGAQRLGRLRGDAAQKQRGRGRGCGQEDAVVDGVLAAFETVALALAADRGDERVDVDVGAGFFGKCFVEFLVALAEGGEDRRGLAGGGSRLLARRLQVGHRGGQVDRAVGGQAVELLGQLRHGGAHAQVVGGARVHAAEQGRHDIVHHVVAVALAHQGADAHIAADGPREALALSFLVDAPSCFLADQVRHRLRGGRDAHHAADRHRAGLAINVEQRAHAGGADQGVGEPELVDKLLGFWATRDEGFCAHIGRPAVEGHGVKLAADAVAAFVDVHGVAGIAQLKRCGQPGKACTDNGDIQWSAPSFMLRGSWRRRR